MPARPQGVYQDKRGKWYFKVTVGRDPLTGKRDQITRRGFATMAEAAWRPSSTSVTNRASARSASRLVPLTVRWAYRFLPVRESRPT